MRSDTKNQTVSQICLTQSISLLCSPAVPSHSLNCIPLHPKPVFQHVSIVGLGHGMPHLCAPAEIFRRPGVISSPIEGFTLIIQLLYRLSGFRCRQSRLFFHQGNIRIFLEKPLECLDFFPGKAELLGLAPALRQIGFPWGVPGKRRQRIRRHNCNRAQFLQSVLENQLPDALSQFQPLQCGAACKAFQIDQLHTARNHHRAQCAAITERILAQGGHAVRQCHGLDSSVVFKGTQSDFLDAIGHLHGAGIAVIGNQ